MQLRVAPEGRTCEVLAEGHPCGDPATAIDLDAEPGEPGAFCGPHVEEYLDQKAAYHPWPDLSTSAQSTFPRGPVGPIDRGGPVPRDPGADGPDPEDDIEPVERM